MKAKQIIIICMVFFVFCSCGNNKNGIYNNVDFGPNISISENYAFREKDGRLYCWDFNSNSYDIFCSQPECKHQTISENPNSKCTAVVPKENYSYNYAFIFNDRLYSICSGVLNEFLIYEADTDGQNRKLRFTAEVSISSMVFPKLIEGKLIFVGSKFDTDNPQKMTEHYLLCTVDLSDFSFKNYGEIGIANETILGTESLYYCDNKIYYQHSDYSGTSSRSTIEYIDAKDSDVRSIFKTNNDNVNVWQYYNDKIIFVASSNNETHSSIYAFDINENKNNLLFEHDGYLSNLYINGNKVFYMFSSYEDNIYKQGAGVYDIESSKDKSVYFTDDEYVSFLGHSAKRHIVCYQNADKNGYGLLSNDDFWNLELKKADVIFEQ